MWKIAELNEILAQDRREAMLLRDIDETKAPGYELPIVFSRSRGQLEIEWRWIESHIKRIATLDPLQPILNLPVLDMLIGQNPENLPSFPPGERAG